MEQYDDDHEERGVRHGPATLLRALAALVPPGGRALAVCSHDRALRALLDRWIAADAPLTRAVVIPAARRGPGYGAPVAFDPAALVDSLEVEDFGTSVERVVAYATFESLPTVLAAHVLGLAPFDLVAAAPAASPLTSAGSVLLDEQRLHALFDVRARAWLVTPTTD